MALRRVKLLATARRWTLPNLKQFQESRQHVVWLLAPFIGVAAGGAAILFRLAIGAFQWPWLHTMTENVAEAARAQPFREPKGIEGAGRVRDQDPPGDRLV